MSHFWLFGHKGLRSTLLLAFQYFIQVFLAKLLAPRECVGHGNNK